VVVFDFDGTIGMVRAGWMPLMLEMMMETLRPLSSDWSALFLEAEDYVARLTGRDTVEQTNAFAEHVGRLGGKPASGQEYKAEFLRRLESLRRGRLEALRAGRMTGDELMIPGARALLEALRGLDLPLYLASGSDHSDISMESGLLGITGYFTGIYGSAPGVPSKQELLNLLLDKGFEAESILMFGDGRTEIELTHAIGGRTVGVASDEPDCVKVDPKKRRWLIDAGADYIIPNYLEPEIIRTVTCF
jgi:phosphoglycolate phosphatase-like HAD superfamily hydrolase